jgi:uncharacterized protein YfaA (DUF2138 family)
MDWTTILTPSLGAAGLLSAVVIMILTGKLLPRASVVERLADKDRQIAIWHDAYTEAIKVQNVQREHISELLEATRTTTHVIQALPRAAELNGGNARAALAEEEA